MVNGVLKIIDFGLAHALDKNSNQLIFPGSVPGSFSYTAPENFIGTSMKMEEKLKILPHLQMKMKLERPILFYQRKPIFLFNKCLLLHTRDNKHEA